MAFETQPSQSHLSASGILSPIPSINVLQKSDTEAVIEEEIPVIDFSLLRGTTEKRAQAVRDLGRACKEWGFFVLVNHGVSETLRGLMLAGMEAFFDLPDNEKTKYTEKRVLDPIQFGTGFNPAAEEVKYWRDFLKVIVHPEFNSPAMPHGFREILQEYTTCTRELAKELLKGIWESLQLEINYIDDVLELDSCFEIFVGNRYPPYPQPELALGLPPHSDFGLVIVLLQNGIDGLQVNHNGRWVNVEALPNSFFINTGDHLEIITNGRYKSVLHRATLNDKSTRISVVTAIGPSREAIVAPAPELVSRDNHQVHYKAMKFWDYAMYQQTHKLKEKSALEHVMMPAE